METRQKEILKTSISFIVLFVLYHLAEYMIVFKNHVAGFFIFQFLFFLSAWVLGNWNQKNGSTLNNMLTDLTVDQSILAAAGYTGPTLYWHTNTDANYYFATTYNNSGNSGAQWVANIVEVNGTVYALDKAIQVSGLYNEAGTAANVQAGLEAMVAAGTAKKLGTIATK